MNNVQIAYTVLGVLGLVMVILGYLIKFKKMINLIAGVYKNENCIKNKEGLANLVGTNILVLGIGFCIGAMGIYKNPEHKSMVETILLLSLLVVFGILFSQAKKFVIQQKDDNK
jgi:drug/metabolite transporter (DMT)-like permease